MRVILLSLVMVCLFGYHANARRDSPRRCLFGHEGCENLNENPCQGFAEFRSEFNGTETVHGKLVKEKGEDALKMNLRYTVPGGRRANITIEVQGNCCWNFYQR